jgi:hypothetical protein
MEMAEKGIKYKNKDQQYYLYQEAEQLRAGYRKRYDKPGKVYFVVEGTVIREDESRARKKITEQTP